MWPVGWMVSLLHFQAIILSGFVVVLGTMEDGQHLTYTSWGLLGWSSLGTSVLVDSPESITHAIIV